MTPAVSVTLCAAPCLPLTLCCLLSIGVLLLSGGARPGAGRSVTAGETKPGSATEKARDSYEEALRLYRSGRFRDALQVIHRVEAVSGTTAALHSLAGWCHLRSGEPGDAESEFGAALVLDPAAIDPEIGLGHVFLRQGSRRRAQESFEGALRRDPRNAEALKGLGLALRDQKRFAEAADAFRRALAAAPEDAEAAGFLDQVLSASGDIRESRPRPPAPAGAPVRVVAQARDGRFFVASGDGGFRPLFIKGVNMGVALPGRFPAEFPADEATYASWLDAIAGMGANVVRLYTLLPPACYAALEKHNKKDAGGRLWLVQGVWTELPEDHDYDARRFIEGFRDEIRRVVDAVHGNLDLGARPGHASGSYRADVSSSLLAFLLGREWEPFSVEAYDQKHARADRAAFLGTYFAADPRGATPFEQWLARQMDFTVDYETTTYRQQRPISFVNWPTLDPLSHPTEPTVAEERELLRRRGEAALAEGIREYDNDAVSVDATHIRPTARAQGGSFATYHAYPYYPDFMSLDPGYSRARDSQGPSNYIGYLRDLSRHHGSQPILIGEVGVPSSRGIAHLQPQGWHHGGHTEREQGEIDARLMQDIDEAGLAGGILFALVDEWFKRNWLVVEFEVPSERNPLWLNVLDPEQSYGILAARPGEKGWAVSIDGRGDDWKGIAPLMEKREGGPEKAFGDGHDAARTLRALRLASDEAYLYLRLDVEKLDADGDGAPDWSAASYIVGIDTYDARRGDHRLPVGDTVRSPIGLEFCLIFDGPETSRLLVDPPYDIDTHRNHRPYQSVENADGRFMEIRVETNRMRIGRDGTVFPAQGYSRSPLRHGSIDPRDPDGSSLADWHVGRDGSYIEARIGWGLLNVTDPSSRRVLHDDPNDLRAIGTLATPGFRFYVAAIKPEGTPGAVTPIPGRLADRLPAGGPSKVDDFPLYAWPVWDRPSFRIEKKEAWGILKQALEKLPSHPEAP